MPEPKLAQPDEFYVGYLPIPAGHLRLLRIAIPALLWFLVVSAVIMAALERSPGKAAWDQGKTIERVGVIHEHPYPYLAPTTGDRTPVFLVEQGKRGTQSRVRGREGQLVRATGWRLDRDGREILELIPEQTAIEIVAGLVPLEEPTRDAGPVPLPGDIVDYNGFL